MWCLLVLFAVGAYAQKNDNQLVPTPPYVQARTAFTHTRLYLQESVPHEANDITDPQARKHFAFGILAAVTGNIAKNYTHGGDREDWLDILDITVPDAWMYYNVVSRVVNELLAEANLKIQQITNLIDAICSTTDSVEQCNAMVEDKIKQSDTYVQNRARLLLALGVVSDMITKSEPELNVAAAEYMVVPYLLKTLQTESYLNFITALANLYDLLRKNAVQY